MIRIRVDDFPWTKENEKDKHSLKAFEEFYKIIRSHDVIPLIGIIPGNCSEDDLRFLKDSWIEPGLHGIFHDESRPNEFLPYQTSAEIEKNLRVYRTLLGASVENQVNVYMPPHNVVDKKTLEAVKRAGFKAWTCGPETPKELKVSYPDFECIDSQKPYLYGRSDELLQMFAPHKLTDLVRENPNQTLTLCLHWTWECNIGYSNLMTFLDWIDHLLKKGSFL